VTGPRLVSILAVLNLPAFFWIFRQFFGYREDFTAGIAAWTVPSWLRFLESVIRAWRAPLWSDSWERDVARSQDEGWQGLKLVVAVLSCAAVVGAEYSAVVYFIPRLVG
jgi:hypothetical protein